MMFLRVSAVLLICNSFAVADSIPLLEKLGPGDYFDYQLKLTVSGKLKIDRNGKEDTLLLEASAAHDFVERVEEPDAIGGAGKVVRHYRNAVSSSKVSGESTKRELSPDRRLCVIQRTPTGTVQYSPSGPLSRDELELVAEHFDTMCLVGFLSGQDSKVGDTWKIPDQTVQQACLFDGLLKNELTAKFVSVQNNTAFITITGTAEGIELGAAGKVIVQAQLEYDTAAKQIQRLNWEQTDVRQQGPASPAMEVTAKIEIDRKRLAEEPKELSAEIRTTIPTDSIPNSMLMLRHLDPNGKYQLDHSRDWQMVGRTRDHLMLRLVEKSELQSQLTVTLWKKVQAGQHSSPAEFLETVSRLPNWQPEKKRSEGELAGPKGYWLYAISFQGQQDGSEVVQNFYLVTGPEGDQVVLSSLCHPNKASNAAKKEVEIVQSLRFSTKK